MVRKSVVALVMLVALALCSVNAYAAGWAIGATGGALKGSGDFGDATKTGIGGGLFADFKVNENFSVGPDFSWTSNKSKDDGEPAAAKYPGATGTISDKLTIMNYGAHAKYMFPMAESPMKPYLVAGAGMYNFKQKLELTGLPTTEPSDTKFGGRGGLGTSYMMSSNFSIGAEGNYHFVNTEGSSTKYITGAVALTYHIPMTK